MRQFRKYPNRRIYDLDNSKYVTLDDLLNWINAGASIHVEEAESGEDLTQATLMQILSKEESRRVKSQRAPHVMPNTQKDRGRPLGRK